MSDLISRKSAIEAIRDIGNNPLLSYSEVMDALAHVPAEESIRWIPCSERLPDKSDDYICRTQFGRIWTLTYSVKYKAFNVSDRSKDKKHEIKVIAWMPLPEYKGGKE